MAKGGGGGRDLLWQAFKFKLASTGKVLNMLHSQGIFYHIQFNM